MYTKQISTVLKNIVIFTRNVEKTAAFYSNALGLKISSQSTQLVELKDTNNTRILLKKVDGFYKNTKNTHFFKFFKNFIFFFKINNFSYFFIFIQK